MSNAKTIEGDLNVFHDLKAGRDAEVRGQMHVHHDIKVGGALISKFVNSANMGLFETETDLKNLYPNPKVGQYAAVGETFPASLYVCRENGIWVDSGKTIDNEVTNDQIRDILHKYVDDSVNAEIERATQREDYIEGKLTEQLDEVFETIPYHFDNAGSVVHTFTSGETWIFKNTGASQISLWTNIIPEDDGVHSNALILKAGESVEKIIEIAGKYLFSGGSADIELSKTNSLPAQIKTEKARAESAETALQNSIAEEKERAEAEESALASSIDTKYEILRESINSEAGRATQAENTLTSGLANISGQVGALQQADTALSGRIDATNTALTAEKTRAITEENKKVNVADLEDLGIDEVDTIWETTSGQFLPTSEEAQAAVLAAVASKEASIASKEASIASKTASELAKASANTAVATANTANNTANGALEKSEEAIETANTASTNASNAVTTANTANTNAGNAVTTANTASTNASNAVSTANTANTNAGNAVTTANTANSNATTAVNTSNQALEKASIAIENASTAATLASSAQSSATSAATSATSAQTYASNAQTSASQAATHLATIENEIAELKESEDIDAAIVAKLAAVTAQAEENDKDIDVIVGTKTDYNKLDVTNIQGIISSSQSNPRTEGGLVIANNDDPDYKYIAVDVVPGEKYKLSGYSSNRDYCGAFLQNKTTAVTMQRVTGTYFSTSDTTPMSFADVEITIPEGYNVLYINGYKQNVPVAKKYMLIQKTSTSFRNEYEQLRASNEEKVGKSQMTTIPIGSKVSKLPISLVEGYLFSSNSLKAVGASGTNYHYACVNVKSRDIYTVSCYKLNAEFSGVFVRKKSGGVGVVRFDDDKSAGSANTISVTIPNGYDEMYVNGNALIQKAEVSQLADMTLTDVVEFVNEGGGGGTSSVDNSIYPLYVHSTLRPTYLPGSDNTKKARYIAINRRLNDSYDYMMRFGNKENTPNVYFDFMKAARLTKGADAINTAHMEIDSGYVADKAYGGLTDYIQPIIVGAENNKNGDFPDDKSKFTGGFHGYNNKTSNEYYTESDDTYFKDKALNDRIKVSYCSTMKEVSKVVKVDGKTLAENEGHAYGNVCEIIVVNDIQGCNTQKAKIEQGIYNNNNNLPWTKYVDDGGRYIIRQKITVKATQDDCEVTVEFKALEDVKIYQLNGFALQTILDNYRLVGSSTKMGSYTDEADTRPDNTDRDTNILRAFGGGYKFECELDKTFGEGTYHNQKTMFGAQATNAKKAYYYLIEPTHPLELKTGEMITFRGWYRFGEYSED